MYNFIGYLEYSIEVMFKETDQKMDVQKVIIKSILHKDLQKCSICVVELVKKLVELFPSYLQQYSDYIIFKCCVPIIKESRSMAKFKEICVKTIHAIVKEALDEDVKLDQLASDIALILKQQVKSGRKLYQLYFNYFYY